MKSKQKFLLALLIRLAIIFITELYDSYSDLKFTDIDYSVYKDSAKFVFYSNGSPYLRSTYRYTPLLSYLMLPSLWFNSSGKMIFALFDVLTGYFMHCIHPGISDYMWLYNPFIMIISCRGNAESVVSLLIFSSLYYLLKRNNIVLGAIMYAIAVHFKIYPMIYSLMLYLYLGNEKSSLMRRLFVPNGNQIVFVSCFLLTLTSITLMFYQIYGHDFIENTYLYHLTRRDHRHNFSIYFPLMYLSYTKELNPVLAFITNPFLLQFISIFFISINYYKTPKLLFRGLFLSTFVFVLYNKVVTSQYFYWYIQFLGLIDIEYKKISRAVIWWVLAQGLWLFFGYLLEMKGYNVFVFLFLSSVVFFLSNINLMKAILEADKEATEEKNK